MKMSQYNLSYEEPTDKDVLEAYINKNRTYKRKDIRDLKRSIRKLRYS